MLDKIQKFREYLDYVERHYNNVQKAWKLINGDLDMKRCDLKYEFSNLK